MDTPSSGLAASAGSSVFPYNNDLSEALDEGEKEAISLAAVLHADTLLLMDDAQPFARHGTRAWP